MNMNKKCRFGLFLAAIFASTFIADVAEAAKDLNRARITKSIIYDNNSFSMDRQTRNYAGTAEWSRTPFAMEDERDSWKSEGSLKSGSSWSSGNFRLSEHYSYPCVVSYVSAVPEPETYAMLLTGLGLLGFMVRRNKIQASN